MEKMLIASGTLTTEYKWGEGSEMGGILLTHRKDRRLSTAGIPDNCPMWERCQPHQYSDSLQQGFSVGWGERARLSPQTLHPQLSNFTIPVPGKCGCNFSLCMKVSIAIIALWGSSKRRISDSDRIFHPPLQGRSLSFSHLIHFFKTC